MYLYSEIRDNEKCQLNACQNSLHTTCAAGTPDQFVLGAS